jgi:hypothetical protein
MFLVIGILSGKTNVVIPEDTGIAFVVQSTGMIVIKSLFLRETKYLLGSVKVDSKQIESIRKTIARFEDLLEMTRTIWGKMEWFCDDANKWYRTHHKRDDVAPYVVPKDLDIDSFEDDLDTAANILSSLRPYSIKLKAVQKINPEENEGLGLTEWEVTVNGVIVNYTDCPEDLVETRMMTWSHYGPATRQTAIWLIWKCTDNKKWARDYADELAKKLQLLPFAEAHTFEEPEIVGYVEAWRDVNVSG